MIPAHTLVDVDEEIFDEIGFEIDLCPRDAVELHVRRTFVDFCERTRFWQHRVLVNAVPGTASYEITLPPGLSLVDVISVVDETNGITLVKAMDSAVAYRYWCPTPGHIEIAPADFTAPFSLTVDVAVRPVAAPEFQVSKQLQDEYRAAVIAGAKAALYKAPGKPWTNLQQAQIENMAYQTTVEAARLHVANGYSRMPLPSVRKNRPYY